MFPFTTSFTLHIPAEDIDISQVEEAMKEAYSELSKFRDIANLSRTENGVSFSSRKILFRELVTVGPPDPRTIIDSAAIDWYVDENCSNINCRLFTKKNFISRLSFFVAFAPVVYASLAIVADGIIPLMFSFLPLAGFFINYTFSYFQAVRWIREIATQISDGN